MGTDLGFAVLGADNHLYETEDAFTRHLPPAHRNLFRFVEIRGRKKLVVRDRLTELIPNPTFEVVARPGPHGVLRRRQTPRGRSLRELTGEPMACNPGLPRPGGPVGVARIQASLMFPTLASLIEQRLIDDPALTQVAIHAFNEWLYEPPRAPRERARAPRNARRRAPPPPR